MLLLIELGIWAVICLGFVAYDIRWGAFWATVVAAAIAAIFLGFNIFAMAWASPIVALQMIGAYCCAGLVWCTIKFIIKMRKARALYIKDKAEYLKGDSTKTEADWITKVKNSYGDKAKYAPTVADNKYDIMFWMWHWPFSVIAFLFEDLIKELWNLSWKMIKGFMEGIRKAALGEAAKDLDE